MRRIKGRILMVLRWKRSSISRPIRDGPLENLLGGGGGEGGRSTKKNSRRRKLNEKRFMQAN